MNRDDKSLLKLLGIEIKDGEISIDFHKAKESLKGLESRLDETASRIKESLSEGKIEIPTVGMDMDSRTKRFEFDLKETKERIDSLVDKLSNLSGIGVADLEEDLNSKSGYYYVYFKVDSENCEKEEIARRVGVEATIDSKESWLLSSPKVKEGDMDVSKLIHNIIKILDSRIDELKDIRKDCKASFSLIVEMVHIEIPYKLLLPKESIKFLSDIEADILIERKV